MKTYLKYLLPVAVLVLGVAGMLMLMKTAPETKRVKKPRAVPVVEVVPLKRSDYQVTLHSQGSVAPVIESHLVAEVRGKIVAVSPHLAQGGFFTQNEWLVSLEDRDYRNAVATARADLAKAKVQLREEQARAEQAHKDWLRLGEGGQANALVLRKPQLESAQAAVEAAVARLAQARLDLQRTRIHAPFTGRVREKQADVGQFVMAGATLATLFGVDAVEIQLPLSSSDYAQLSRIWPTQHAASAPTVTLSSAQGQWQGRLVRDLGIVDPLTRQHIIVVQVTDPYRLQAQAGKVLEVGRFVSAEIPAGVLHAVFVIPATAVREGSYVLIEQENRLKRVPIKPVWRSTTEVVVQSGLEAGMHLITTPMTLAAEGMSVKVAGRD